MRYQLRFDSEREQWVVYDALLRRREGYASTRLNAAVVASQLNQGYNEMPVRDKTLQRRLLRGAV